MLKTNTVISVSSRIVIQWSSNECSEIVVLWNILWTQLVLNHLFVKSVITGINCDVSTVYLILFICSPGQRCFINEREIFVLLPLWEDLVFHHIVTACAILSNPFSLVSNKISYRLKACKWSYVLQILHYDTEPYFKMLQMRIYVLQRCLQWSKSHFTSCSFFSLSFSPRFKLTPHNTNQWIPANFVRHFVLKYQHPAGGS